MVYDQEIAKQVAAYLLEIQAVKLSPKEPFTWASGIKSPIYCDNRITLSYPPIRKFIQEQFSDAIRKQTGIPELIAGVATGGIAQGALVAGDLNLPFAYVRTTRKDHGLTNLIEGKTEPGQSVVVIEDLISTGKSSLEVVRALREAGCNVTGMLAIFTYNLTVAINGFTEAVCPLITLTDYDILVEKALEINYITRDDLSELIDFKRRLNQ